MDVDDQKTGLKDDYSNFDIKKYGELYVGRIKIDRLLHISRIVNTLKGECYLIAANEVQKGIDVSLYDKVTTQAQKILGSDKIKIKAQWMGEQRTKNDKQV